MKKLYLIFDYFKEAYHISRQNKALYLPQIVLIIIKTLMLAGMGMLVYSNFDSIFTLSTGVITNLLFEFLIILAGLLLGYGAISLVVESGLYNMYKKAIMGGKLEGGEFSEGVGKYFFKFLLGYIVLMVIFLLSIPVFAIVGIVTVTIGISILVLLMGIYLTMWKLSLVMDDCGVITAFKNSFRFANKNFVPVAFLQLIHWAFQAGPAKGGGSNFSNVSNIQDIVNNTGAQLPGGVDPVGLSYLDYQVLKIFKTVVLILIPVISIATLVGTLIKILFEVFFVLALGLAYKNGFVTEDPQALIPEAAAENTDSPGAEDTQAQDNQDGEVLS